MHQKRLKNRLFVTFGHHDLFFHFSTFFIFFGYFLTFFRFFFTFFDFLSIFWPFLTFSAILSILKFLLIFDYFDFLSLFWQFFYFVGTNLVLVLHKANRLVVCCLVHLSSARYKPHRQDFSYNSIPVRFDIWNIQSVFGYMYLRGKKSCDPGFGGHTDDITFLGHDHEVFLHMFDLQLPIYLSG